MAVTMFRLYYSALIDVKRNFEQTNPFECFFTLRGFTLIENRNKNCNSILPANMQFSESLHREVHLNMIYNSFQTGRNVHYN